MKRFYLFALLLTACPQHVDHRGEPGWYCKPDGTCNGPLLECHASAYFLGVAVDLPSCQPKAQP